MSTDRRRLAARLPTLLGLAVALYWAVWGGEYSAFDLLDLADRQELEAERLTAARAHVDSLRHVAEMLENDAATIESVARERFGMIRDRELLYRFVEVAEDSTVSPR